ncbi:MAG: tetratricopeptide repeat protein [Verrucomicrobiota bacterium JB024]|nr:tetratricopeptide repeat protein [Verrucomicrobiota bacterium JB024]
MSLRVPICLLLVVFQLTSARWTQAAGKEYDIAKASEQSLYEQLSAGLNDKLYKVRPAIEELMRRKTGLADRENFIFLMALSYQDEYTDTQEISLLQQAIEYYEKYLSEFPGGSRSDFVRFNLAGAHEDTENNEAAIREYLHLYHKGTNKTLWLEARDRLCRLYIRTDRAAEGIQVFTEVFNASALNPELLAQSASWLLQGHLMQGETDQIVPYLRYLTDGREAVYDPRFNITLLKQGDRLFDEKNYDQAILLYTFVKSRSAIMGFYTRLIAELEQKLSYLRPETEQYTVIEGQLKRAQANLAGVQEIREYDVDMNWRIARVYQETERHWEALWEFYHLYLDNAEHEQAEDFLYTAFNEAVTVSDSTMLEQLAIEYLKKKEYQKFRRQVLMGMAELYLNQDRGEALLTLVNDYLSAPESYEVAAQLLNYLGAYFMRHSEYLQLCNTMTDITSRHSGRSLLNESGTYWQGLSHLLLADYTNAERTFSRFLKQYTASSIYYEDAMYRYGICLYGKQDPNAAEKQFESFVQRYPKSRLRGEAELYLGDIKRERGEYTLAAEHYRKVEDNTDNATFVAKAVLALSDVIEKDGDHDEAVAVLNDYIHRYREQGQVAEAYERIGMIYDRSGYPQKRFAIHGQAIQQLGNDIQRDAVDRIILNYAHDYQDYMRSYADSLSLLERMLEDEEFRRHFLTDRAYQYQFLLSAEGKHIDRDLADLLVHDREFRRTIIETESESSPELIMSSPPSGPFVTEEMVRAQLEALKENYLAKQEALLPYDAETLFSEWLDQAQREGHEVLAMRVRQGLHEIGSATAFHEYSQDELMRAPSAVLLAEGRRVQSVNPNRAKEIYEMLIQRYPYATSVHDALEGLGEIAIDQAEQTSSTQDWEEALSYYNLIIERYPGRIQDASAYLRQGRILSKLGREDDAIAVLGMVLRNPQWRGLDQAKAHLEIGLAYRRKHAWAEAHGFFERLIVAYGGYAETVSWAYYYDLLTLEQMGETQSVRQLLAEYKTRLSVLSQTTAYPLIKEKYDL